MLLSPTLDLTRCPHCAVAAPNVNYIHEAHTDSSNKSNARSWRIYCCRTCGGLITASARNINGTILQIFPELDEVDTSIPEKARQLLSQAIQSQHAPAGAVMLCASAVDAMLKDKKLIEGSLYKRIDKAASDHLITAEMATWAHQIRLEANDQRHADEHAKLPGDSDAKKCIEFAKALGRFLFELPAMVTRGLQDTKPK